MSSKLVLACSLMAAAPATVEGILFQSGNSNRLQPQVVATSLLKMEDEWRSQAELFAECNATVGGASCNAAIRAFEKSCATVVGAVQTASSGDRSVVQEYMGDVCGQNVLEGWRKERCQSLALTITGAMTADAYENRESLNIAGLCKKYWSSFAVAEAARVVKERAEEDAKRVAREAEEKKLAEEQAKAEKKAAEEAAKKEEQRKAAEAARKQAEDKRKAEEAKKKADKEAAELKAKEEAALKEAANAKRKMSEAKAAAEDAHKKREAKSVPKAAPVQHANTTEVAAKPVVHAANSTKVASKK